MGRTERGVGVRRGGRCGYALAALLAVGSAGSLSAAEPMSPMQQPATEEARQVADWVRGTRENQARPYAIVDKRDARIYVYDAAGTLVGVSAVLLGQTPGDAGTPLDSRHPYSLPVGERTTPAGRFVSRPGHNDKGDAVVWFDHAAALAIHRLRPAPPQQRREARLDSPTPEDNRISLGCVIVPGSFYDGVVGPTLGRGRGVVYVLPETMPVHALFGPRVEQTMAAFAF